MNRCFAFLNKTTIVLLSYFFMSSSAMATATMPVKEIMNTAKPALTNEQKLATILPSDEVMWLDIEGGKFLALKRDYLATTQHGIAVIVSDVSAPINYTQDIEPLRTNINQYGWTTLAINAPSITLLNAKESSEAKDAGEKSMPDKASDKEEIPVTPTTKMNGDSPYVSALIERVISAQKWAATHSKNVILVIQGRQVAYLLDALIQQHLPPFKAVVVLDSNGALAVTENQPYATSMEQLSVGLSQLKMPLLDIYHIKNGQIEAQMLKRKRLSVKEKQKSYRQYLKSTYSEEQQLAKVVYGWLKSLGLN
jgi:hypothetical protein